jgi:hypothetical protein
MFRMGWLKFLRPLLMAASLIACTAPGRQLPTANAAACSVYEAFYEQLSEKEGVFFRSATLPLPPIAGGLFDRRAEWARQFHLEGRRDSVVQRFREDLSIDVLPYFDGLESPPASIVSCFSNGRPAIHDGTLNQARWREVLSTFAHQSHATLVTVSPVAISPDGQYAIIYASFECGGLCGRGAFYAFERRNTWTRIGTLGVWVS